MFCKKRVLRNFTKYTGKHLCKSLFFNEVSGLRPATLLKTRLLHRCFPVNFVKFLRTPILTKHLRWLLIKRFLIYQNIFPIFPITTKTTSSSSTFPLTQQHTNKHLLKLTSLRFGAEQYSSRQLVTTISLPLKEIEERSDQS